MVAVSGGVDSTAAAWLMKARGWDVIGVTIRLFSPGDACVSSHGFLSPETVVHRAAEVCQGLGIPHRILDLGPAFRDEVLSPFFREYETGLTPNPCVWCNPRVKWDALLRVTGESPAARVVTGHYARTDLVSGRVRLLRGNDRSKDQSYALYRLDQRALSRTLFPLGAWTKDQVRALAREQRLPARTAPESQDICFLPRKGLDRCLARCTSSLPGPVVDRHGKELGTHRGLPFYTIGQRRGLGIPHGHPLYVIRKDAARNLLQVGAREDLCRLSFRVREVCWVSVPAPSPGDRIPVQVELRFRSRPVPGEVRVLDGAAARITLAPHEQSVAPGQSAVWYRGDVLLGGGIIGPDPPDAASAP